VEGGHGGADFFVDLKPAGGGDHLDAGGDGRERRRKRRAGWTGESGKRMS
jgi:hypothetical protein